MAQLAIAPALMAAPTVLSPLARVDVHASFDEAREAWHHLEAQRLLTPYQHHDFIRPWWEHAGRHEHDGLAIAVGHCARGAPLFLWPLARRRRGMFTVAEPLGGKHANYHFGLWSAGMLDAGMPAFNDALAKFSVAAHGIDALVLANQLREWNGRVNPFAMRDPSPAPSDAYGVRLERDPEAYMQRVMSHDTRKQIRGKIRKLEALPQARIHRATAPADIDRLLDAFLVQRAERFIAMGVSNPFAAAGIAEWLRDAAHRRGIGDTVSLELYGVEAEGKVIAVAGGIGDGTSFSCMFNSYDSASPHARITPVYALTAYLVADLCRRGFEWFDLGVGEARYKSHFCDRTAELVDACVPLTPLGSLYAAGRRSAMRVKRHVKRSPTLWSLAQRVRRLSR